MFKKLKNFAVSFIAALLLTACSADHSWLPFGGGTSSTPPPQNVALLLPLQGQWAGASNAIKNGFFTSYYADHSTNKPLRVQVYDTSQGNVVGLYNQAVSEGANLVIGPLTKNEVNTLAQQGQITVPTIALNNLDSSVRAPRNFYQYALSPQDEAQEAARQAWRDGRRSMLMITPQNAWGQSVTSAFVSTWTQQGGVIVGDLTYNSASDMTKGMAQLLQYSQTMVPDPKVAGGKRLVPNRRQDFDAIFLVASPQMAALVRPLLIFYFAGDVPVYATSSVYTGQSSAGNTDLDGIRFCDMPWVLENTPAIVEARTNAATLWPNSATQYTKLYAMGLDTYTVMQNLNAMRYSSSYHVEGMTGLLWMDDDRVVHRQLDWALFEGGMPQLIGIPSA